MELGDKVILLEGCEHLQEKIQASLSNISLCVTECPDDGVHHKLQLRC